jgi:ABC-type glycerol-3-phosphate transport system permease component
MENLAHWVIVAGGLIIALVLVFGFIVFCREAKRTMTTFCYPLESPPDKNTLAALKDSYLDVLEKRNEFWFGFGQIVIVALIVVVLTVLLLTEKISPEAGLPILSALSGFAIAKTANTVKRYPETGL